MAGADPVVWASVMPQDRHVQNLLRDSYNMIMIQFEISCVHFGKIGVTSIDGSQQVGNEALRIISVMSHMKESTDILNDFLTEQVRDMGQKNGYLKDQLECLSIVAATAFADKEAVYAPHGRKLLVPFSHFLVKNLLEIPILSTNGIRLLTQVLPLAPGAADIAKLLTLIISALSIHSSDKRLSAPMDLVQSALDSTDLKFTVYEDNCSIMGRLLELAQNQTHEGSQTKFLKLLSSIGPVKPSIIQGSSAKVQMNEEALTASNTPNVYIADLDPSVLVGEDRRDENQRGGEPRRDQPKDILHPRLEAVSTAAVGVALLNLLDILSEESLSGLHADTIDAILNHDLSSRRVCRSRCQSCITGCWMFGYKLFKRYFAT